MLDFWDLTWSSPVVVHEGIDVESVSAVDSSQTSAKHRAWDPCTRGMVLKLALEKTWQATLIILLAGRSVEARHEA